MVARMKQLLALMLTASVSAPAATAVMTINDAPEAPTVTAVEEPHSPVMGTVPPGVAELVEGINAHYEDRYGDLAAEWQRDLHHRERLRAGAARVDRVVAAALQHVGTPYVFSGSSPGGWDCSGLIRWAYQRAGVTLAHSAAAQSLVGQPVARRDLLPGDIVGWRYSTARTAYHTGLYIGNDRVLQALKAGTRTHVIRLSSSSLAGTTVFRRVIPRDDSTPGERRSERLQTAAPIPGAN